MTTATESAPRKSRWTTKRIVFTYIGVMLVLAVALGVLFGSAGRNNAFQPQDEFQLHSWIPIKIGPLDMSINRAVLYLFIACGLTSWVMIWIARRMSTDKPNNVQTAVETVYDFANRQIVRNNMDERMSTKWFAVVATLFFFIWISNLIGYLPLPTSHEKLNIFGAQIPAFAIYAATANISVPLVLALCVSIAYNVEGIRAKGFIGYLKSLLPEGTPSGIAPLVFAIEIISHFVRIISLSVRLFANMLAGHLLILFMAGGLAVLLGLAAIGAITTLTFGFVFFVFEVGLVASLQAFIFATLTSIYLGGAVAEHH
jgi:F-type H+-transporting ATPase subunit a